MSGDKVEVRSTKVEFLTNRDRARENGVKSIPALGCAGTGLELLWGAIEHRG